MMLVVAFPMCPKSGCGVIMTSKETAVEVLLDVRNYTIILMNPIVDYGDQLQMMTQYHNVQMIVLATALTSFDHKRAVDVEYADSKAAAKQQDFQGTNCINIIVKKYRTTQFNSANESLHCRFMNHDKDWNR